MRKRRMRRREIAVGVALLALGTATVAAAATRSYLAAPPAGSPASAAVAVGRRLSRTQSARLGRTCPGYATAGGTGYWACTVNASDVRARAPTAAETDAAAKAARAAHVQAQAAAASAENHYGTADCVPSSPYHCYLSNFVEFGLGPYPLGFVHVEENTNLNGRQFQTGAALSLVVRGQPGDAAIRQAWKFHCAVARAHGPRRSCGDITEAIAAFNRERKTQAHDGRVSSLL